METEKGSYQPVIFYLIFPRHRQQIWQPQREKTYLRARLPSEDSDQPENSRCLIRIFNECILDRHKCTVFSCGEQKFWSGCADVQADLSLRWAHLLEGTFSHVAANDTIEITSVERSLIKLSVSTCGYNQPSYTNIPCNNKIRVHDYLHYENTPIQIY